MSKLGILFDIEKLDSAIYGSVAWDIFWQAIGPEGLADGVRLYEGDTAATLDGREHLYCLVIESRDAAALDAIQAKLATNEAYLAVAVGRRFLSNEAVESEPLPLVGHFKKGKIVGENAVNPRAALTKLRRLSAPTEGIPLPSAPDRPRPASPRSADLSELTDLEGLIAVLGRHFPGKGHTMRFSLTPEELCDVAERYADVFDVYWDVGESVFAETGSFVSLMPKDRHDTKLDCFGLMEFPSRKDAISYCEREYITPREWGLIGMIAQNFVGMKYVNDVYETLYRDHLSSKLIRVEELWPRICARRNELNITGSTDGSL